MTKYLGFDSYESIEEAFEIKRPKRLDLAGNTNGDDVECVHCGEPWENGHVVEEEKTFGEIYLTQMFDDRDGDDLIMIAGVGKCPCCKGE